MSNENNKNHCLCDALIELYNLQDFMINSSTKYFGRLLSKLVGTDTIPLLFITKNGLLELKSDELIYGNPKESFKTTFFRIEKIDQEKCTATVSLLHPMTIEGDIPFNLCDVIKLTRTSLFKEIELGPVCAIQTLDTELLKRNIIIEPKW